MSNHALVLYECLYKIYHTLQSTFVQEVVQVEEGVSRSQILDKTLRKMEGEKKRQKSQVRIKEFLTKTGSEKSHVRVQNTTLFTTSAWALNTTTALFREQGAI